MAMSFDPFGDLDRITGALFGARQGGPRFMPVDLFRDRDQYILTADLPGVDPGSVDIDVDGQLLTIRAERTAGTHDGVKWLSQERAYGSYLRQFSLGEGVDAASISAHYDNGVLSVVIPMGEKAKPRKIEVATAGASKQKTIAS
jgi:HSP20 family protein